MRLLPPAHEYATDVGPELIGFVASWLVTLQVRATNPSILQHRHVGKRPLPYINPDTQQCSDKPSGTIRSR